MVNFVKAILVGPTGKRQQKKGEIPPRLFLDGAGFFLYLERLNSGSRMDYFLTFPE